MYLRDLHRCASHNKRHLYLLVLGNVDSGRSTLIEDLIPNTIRPLDTWKKIREEGSRELLRFHFVTDRHCYSIGDTGGHKDFSRFVITGFSHAHVALVTVSADLEEFDVSFKQGSQTLGQIAMSATLGIKNLIICVNKMDHPDVQYKEQHFIKIKNRILTFLFSTGYDPEKRLKWIKSKTKLINITMSMLPRVIVSIIVEYSSQDSEVKEDKSQVILSGDWRVTFIPISALYHENIFKRSNKMAWYSGPTLYEALDNVEVKTLVDFPLRFSLHDVYKVGGIGTVPVTKVQTGKVMLKQKIIFSPVQKRSQVTTFETRGGDYFDTYGAQPGDHFGFSCAKLKKEEIFKDCIVGDPKMDPPFPAESFLAQVVIISTSEEKKSDITIGSTPLLYCHNVKIPVLVKKIYYTLNKRNLELIKNNPAELKANEVALVEFVPSELVCLETFAEYPPLGRFKLKTKYFQTIGFGIIKQVKKRIGNGKFRLAGVSESDFGAKANI